MHLFETVLAMLFSATVLSIVAKRLHIPYPTLLALGGAIITFLPGAPSLNLLPELILALFVAPVLLDAAYDASLRDLQVNWRPVLSLVVVAVGLTTLAVAVTARWLFPDLPWGAAMALGALLAPPDAVAALAVMQQVRPPHQIRKVLEGESLLNDASALLVYKLAVGVVAAGGFSLMGALPTFLLVVLGSTLAAWLLTFPLKYLNRLSDEPATAVIIQFVMTFSIWLLAERLGLSPVVTIVVFAMILSRQGVEQSARLRVPTFAVWEAATFVLNVLAFTLIGLELAPIREALPAAQQTHLLGAAILILVVVILVRLIWTALYLLTQQSNIRVAGLNWNAPNPLTPSSGLVVGWAGMRGIVTLAAALALPEGFPQRDFMLLTAFVVVLGTLVIQGLTLRPLLLWLRLPADDTVDRETNLARSVALQTAMRTLEPNPTLAAQRLREEYRAALSITIQGGDLTSLPDNALRRQVLGHCRDAIADLRRTGDIGDDAYRQVEAELDVLELMAGTATAPPPGEKGFKSAASRGA